MRSRLSASSVGFVLAGAAALGAYEAGVLAHVLGPIAREIGRRGEIGVLSGTSSGAINATALAAFADDPELGASRMCETWAGLRLGQVLRPSAIELLRSALEMTDLSARVGRALRLSRARGGLLDPRPITRLLGGSLPVERISQHLVSGELGGIALSATHVATGRSTVFYQTARSVSPWAADGAVAVTARIELTHAMASAAIPMLLPPVAVDGELYCDGGLRQMVPLSPCIHLGARRLLVINPLSSMASPADEAERCRASTSPLYLAGKALNALFADRTEVDLARLEQVSAVLRAGRRRYGPTFEAAINAELASEGGRPLREISALRIGPSRELGRLAAEYAASPELSRRERGLVAFVMRLLAETGHTRAGDLLSYLLFDGGFASELIAIGRADARARHAELCAFLSADDDA